MSAKAAQRACNMVDNEVPSWLQTVSFNNAIEKLLGPFQCITALKVEPDSGNATDILQKFAITADVQTAGGFKADAHFILMCADSEEAKNGKVERLKLMLKEESMYYSIIPKFEQLYRNVGRNVRFAPSAFKFDRNPGHDYVLTEDLSQHGYQTAGDVIALNMEFMQQALGKLAEFHAASACFVEHFGMFGSEFKLDPFIDDNRQLFQDMNSSAEFLAQLRTWSFGQQYYAKLANCDSYLVDCLYRDQKLNPNEFNVLSHGDCVAKNIRFYYDELGKIRETVFVGFQNCRYGSPANDLYHLILSSAAMDIKISQFDYMIWYYYDRLIKSLQFLQYPRPLPKLRSLQLALLHNGLSAYLVVSKVLPIAMCESRLKRNNRDIEAHPMASIYSNARYVQMMCQILPWLEQRGLLDWK